MLNLAIMMWMMMELNAPDWCYTCWWIAAICTGISFVVNCIKIGKEL